MHPEAITSKQKELLKKLPIPPDFYLAGGTALALQIGHRVSVDFDFFTHKKLPQDLLARLQKTLKDVAASKAHTIGRRAALRDYIDLYFILKEHHATLSEIISIAQRKYGEGFDPRIFLEQLLYLEDVPSASTTFLKAKVDREQIQKYFEQETKKIRL